jgi:hypothetical protein
MTTLDVQQRSEQWYEARRGLPTCSRFDQILTAAKAQPAAAQQTLINELIAESICPPEQGVIRHVTAEMEYGMKLEAEARCCFELQYATGPVSEVGFVLHSSSLCGGSPDALVGDDSGVEVKCPTASVHVGYIREGVLPQAYRCQVNGYMIVTGRRNWSFFSYCRNFPPFHLRVEWSDFTDKLEAELFAFCKRYNAERAKFDLRPIGSA